MIITWHGFSCFRIQESRQGGEVSLVTDPYQPEGGQKMPRNLSADVVTVSHDHPRHNATDLVGGTPFVISGAGEYEVKDIFVTGIPTFHDLADGKEKGTNTMYRITVGDVHMVHLGDLGHALEERNLEDFHEIDVLFVPVGGSLSAKLAAEIIGQLEPRIVIPMQDGGSGMADFVKAMGLGKPETLPKLKITAKDLPQEETKIVILEPQ